MTKYLNDQIFKIDKLRPTAEFNVDKKIFL